jgi:hypothetical protein
MKIILSLIIMGMTFYSFSYGLYLFKSKGKKLPAFGVFLISLLGTVIPIFLLFLWL